MFGYQKHTSKIDDQLLTKCRDKRNVIDKKIFSINAKVISVLYYSLTAKEFTAYLLMLLSKKFEKH